MEAGLTVKDIAEALQITKQAIFKRSQKDNWPFKESPNKTGGGIQKIFDINKLPLDIHAAVMASRLKCETYLIPPKEIDENKIKEISDIWSKQPEKNQNRALIRLQILQALDEYCKASGHKQTYAEKIFSVLYLDRNAPGVDAEIYTIESGISEATLRRWRAAYKKEGLIGLLPKYKTNSGIQTVITPEMKTFIYRHIAQKPGIKTAHIFKLITKTFQNDPPSRKTVYRYVNRLKKDDPALFSFLRDPSEWKNKYQPSFGDSAAGIDYFCHTWEMDSTPADVVTSDGKRCAIVGTIDIFSRKAVVVVSPTSKSLAIAACIKKGILKWAVPGRIRKDNGSDYKSAQITTATEVLGIQTPPLKKYTPEQKPFVERFFSTLSVGLEELLPGYIGHCVKDRQAIRERNTWGAKIMEAGAVVEIPVSMQELQAIIDKWIEVYENAPHSGIGNQTPFEKAKQSRFFPQKIRDERRLDELLAPVENRTVTKKGIKIGGFFYVNIVLMDHIGKPVIVRRNLTNAGIITVYSRSTGEFICAASNGELQGQALEEYIIAKKRHLKNLKGQVTALNYLKLGHRNAVQILLEDQITPREEKLIPFQQNADSPAIREAMKAAEASALSELSGLESQQNKPIRQLPVKCLIDPVDSSWMSKEDIDREFENSKPQKMHG
jgi:transposase InsO family protein